MVLQLLIVGRTERAEALPLADWMTQHLRPAESKTFVSLSEALLQLQSQAWNPDLVVVVQSWSDEYSREEIDQLSRFAPLARWVVCCGAWCESDGRTRDLWPLAVRVPLRSAESRLAHEWRLLNGDTVVPLPMSASREETFGVDHAKLISIERPVVVGVSSPDAEYQRYLVELLSRMGHTVVQPSDEFESPDLWLMDLDPWDQQRRRSVQQFRAREPKANMIGLMNLPAPELTREVLELGAVDVVPKLGSQQRLLETITNSVRDQSLS